MARFAYQDTWQIVLTDIIKELQLLDGRKRPPYFATIKVVDNFICSLPQEDLLLDVGCGHNPYKIHYPEYNIYGYDRTLEADSWGFVDDINHNSIPYCNAMSINAIHFGHKDQTLSYITKIMEHLPRNGQFLFTINDFGEVNDFAYFENFDWETIDKVEYQYVRTKQLKQNLITEAKSYLDADDTLKKAPLTRDKIIKKLSRVIDHDHHYGCIRIILRKTR